MRIWVWGAALLWAGMLGAEAPKDMTLVRVVTRTAVVFKAADLASPAKGRVQFRDSFELLDDRPENGFWKVQFSDGPGYILAAQSQRAAAPGDPSYRLSAALAGTGTASAALAQATSLSPAAQTPAGGVFGDGLAPTGRVPKAVQDLQRLPPRPKGTATGPRPHSEPPQGAAAATGSAPTAGDRPAGSGPAWSPTTPPAWMLYVPLNWGLGGATEPAFRPSASAEASRPIEGAFGWGLGLQGRFLPWLDLYGEWSMDRHSTHAADRGEAALPQGLSSSAAVLFAEDGLDYVMQSHTFSLGARLGHYWAPIKPWLGLALTEQIWDAEYQGSSGHAILGRAQGQALGVEASIGLDIYLKLFGAGVAKVAPFVAFMSPTVQPDMTDVGGTGLSWSDRAGTPVRAPLRFGVQLGVGF